MYQQQQSLSVLSVICEIISVACVYLTSSTKIRKRTFIHLLFSLMKFIVQRKTLGHVKTGVVGGSTEAVQQWEVTRGLQIMSLVTLFWRLSLSNDAPSVTLTVLHCTPLLSHCTPLFYYFTPLFSHFTPLYSSCTPLFFTVLHRYLTVLHCTPLLPLCFTVPSLYSTVLHCTFTLLHYALTKIKYHFNLQKKLPPMTTLRPFMDFQN